MMLAQDTWLFGSLMSLGGQGLNGALELMPGLPVSKDTLHRIPEGNDERSDDLGISLMLHSCRLGHASISPMDALNQQWVVRVPAQRLLHILSRVYSKAGTSMGGDIPRMSVHLMFHIIETSSTADGGSLLGDVK
jgi:hypothetical protein